MTVIVRRVVGVAGAAGVVVSLLVGLVTLMPLTTALAAASARVVSFSEYTDNNPSTPRHIAGEVLNDGTSSVSDVLVTLTLRGSAGNALATVQRTTVLSLLAPGERSPFGYGFAPPAGYDHTTVDGVAATETTAQANRSFTLTSTIGAPDPAGYRQVDGTVRNDNTTTAVDVIIGLTFYDGADQVVGVAAVNPDDGGSSGTYDDLDPGQTKPFRTSLAPGFPAFSRFVLVPDSPSAPTGAASPSPSPSASTAASPVATPSDGTAPSPSASTSPEASAGPSASASASAAPVVCAAGLTVSSGEITAAQPVLVTLTGQPGDQVTLEGYSRPASSYTAVRPPVVLGSDGTAQWSITPSTNTRVRAHGQDCEPSASSALVRVHPVLTFVVQRTGARRYVFTGRILPGAVNAGRTISLYYRLPGADLVRRTTAPVAGDGSFVMDVLFGGSARVDVEVRTGANAVNEAGRSNSRSLLVY